MHYNLGDKVELHIADMAIYPATVADLDPESPSLVWLKFPDLDGSYAFPIWDIRLVKQKEKLVSFFD
jgi:hypothetical protein